MEKRLLTGEQREFLEVIKGCRRRMNVAQTWEKLAAAVAVGAGFGLAFEAAAFVLPFYYADLYAFLAVAAGALTGLVIAYLRRVPEAAAALRIDGFGFEERVITAYEAMMGKQKQSPFLAVQQADAIRRLREGRDRIRIALCPSVKKTVLCVSLLLAVAVLSLVPSAMKERAEALHELKQEAMKKQKEIETVVKEMEELAEQELTEEQLAALQEMMGSLQSSYAEYEQVSSAEALSAAGQKLDYKYEDISSKLEQMAQSLQNGAAASTPQAMTQAMSMQDLAQKMQSLNGSGQNGGQNGSQGNNSQNGSQGGDGQNGSQGSNSQNGSQSGSQGSNSQNGNQNGSQGNNGQNGNQDGDGQGDGSQGNSNQNGGQGSNDQDGNQGGDGQSGGNQGDGSQGGSGQGGDGQNGQGGSQGGSGSGRGTGTANISRDYISIPNAIGDDDVLTGQAGASDNSDVFRAQNGLSWEGERVSYDSVIGEYREQAYEGISNGKYPSGMEDVIKEYFGSFND